MTGKQVDCWELRRKSLFGTQPGPHLLTLTGTPAPFEPVTPSCLTSPKLDPGLTQLFAFPGPPGRGAGLKSRQADSRVHTLELNCIRHQHRLVWLQRDKTTHWGNEQDPALKTGAKLYISESTRREGISVDRNPSGKERITEREIEARELEAWKAGFQTHTGTQERRYIQSFVPRSYSCTCFMISQREG